jgi:PAS domain S-box-containing protein
MQLMERPDRGSALELERIFPGASEMAARMRAFDWAQSDLGAPEIWPANLCGALSLCLTSRFPILLWWGPQLTVLYNDACIPFLGETKHPQALAQPGQVAWAEIWDTIGPLLASVRATGRAIGSEDFLFFLARQVAREEVYVRFTFDPILAADGHTVDGIFTPCTETTELVITARRLETLRMLGVQAAEARTVEGACQAAVEVLAENLRDIPFAGVYLLDEAGATLAATAGLAAGANLLPLAMPRTSDDASPWRPAAVWRTQRPEAVDLSRLDQLFPGGPWPDPSPTALVLPIMATYANPAGLLIAGVSARRPLNAAYRTFFDLVAGSIGTAIAGSRAGVEEREGAGAAPPRPVVSSRTTAAGSDAEPGASRQAGAAVGPALLGPAATGAAPARILLADDNADMRRYLQHLLEQRYEILAVADGEAALHAVHAHQPDLVIADVMMPRLDGFALLRRLRADPHTSSTAVILLSGRGSEEARVACLAAGADDYLTKPFGARELLARVEGTLALVRLRREAGRREEELRAEVANVLASMAEGFMAFDAEWRIIYFNAAAEQDSRTPRAEVLGRNYWEAFPLVAGTPLEHEFRRVMADRVPRRVENHYAPFDHWFEMIISPVKDGGIAVYGHDITDHKRAEEAVHQSEVRFRALFEHSHDAILIADDNSIYVDANPAAAKLFGVPVAQLIGRSLYDFVATEHGTHAARLWSEFIAAGFQQGEFEIRRPDGQRRVLEYSAVANILPGQHFSTMRDISERKRTEEALRESEARLRLFVGQTPAILWTTDRNLVITSSVGAGLAQIGLQPNEAVGESLYQHLQTDDPTLVPIAAHLRALAGEASSYEMEEAGVVFQSYVEPFRDEAGQIVGTIGTGLDITARKQAEQALRESEARFRTVADLVPDLLWSRDAHGREWYNQRWTEYTGQRSEQAAGFGWLDVIHPDDRPQSLARFEQALSTGQSFRHEQRIRGTDGAYRWFLVQVRPLRDEQGQIACWFGATDIHDQRVARDTLEERVRQRTAAVEAASVALQTQMEAREAAEGDLRQSNMRLRTLSERLLAVQEEERRTIARELHDEIGQYLTGFRFMLESLGKVTAIPPDPQLANALAVVDDLTTRVRELALGLRPSILDDAGLAPALLWHVERYSRQTGIAVTLGYQGLDERLPAPIETAVYRIVQEALTNVARHAETPQVNVQILADGLVTVLIEDAGKGFDVEAVLARHASTGVSGMRERVELLGGEFLIESQPGGGTRVLVEIPLDAVQ